MRSRLLFVLVISLLAAGCGMPKGCREDRSSGIAAAEYLWTEWFTITAQFDYYSSPYHGTGTQVLDRGVTEAVLGFNCRVTRNFLWQVYGVENLDFIRGSAADFTLSTVLTYRFGS